MTTHIIMWSGQHPTNKQLSSQMESIPHTHVFTDFKEYDIPGRGKTKAMIFAPVPNIQPVDLDDPIICTFTPPVIHDVFLR